MDKLYYCAVYIFFVKCELICTWNSQFWLIYFFCQCTQTHYLPCNHLLVINNYIFGANMDWFYRLNWRRAARETTLNETVFEFSTIPWGLSAIWGVIGMSWIIIYCVSINQVCSSWRPFYCCDRLLEARSGLIFIIDYSSVSTELIIETVSEITNVKV